MGVVSKRLRDSAKGRDCTLRFDCCNFLPETTVLAHLPSPVGGVATKGDDWHAVFACSACHAALDESRYLSATAGYALRALQRTQAIWVAEGLLVVAGDREPKPRSSTSKNLPPKRLFK